MSTDLETVEVEAMKLLPADRSRLAERLIASLGADPEVEQAWLLEADRREKELEAGAVQIVPGDQAIARFRAKLAP